ncbi:MAG: TetR/AcrR family transcriptional regulator [Rhizobiaceae bacterium]
MDIHIQERRAAKVSAQAPHAEGTPSSGSGQEAILTAAADCFMEAGYNATSIDDVAHRLSATKGMIYHYYRSKADLFFDVHRRGMRINLDAIQPMAHSSQPPLQRFEAMCRAHLLNMMEHIRFQRVVMQGVEMHLAGATTPAQREQLAVLMSEREQYENLFRAVMVEGRDAGVLAFDNPSFASKAVLAILNTPVLWYRRREDESLQSRNAIIDQFTRFALACAGATTHNPTRSENTIRSTSL